ncbi:hypothetical protein BJX70DRAFT_397601 [Aspergillus crustosus]
MAAAAMGADLEKPKNLSVGEYIGIAILFAVLTLVLYVIGLKWKHKYKRRGEAPHPVVDVPLTGEGPRRASGTPYEMSEWLGVTRPRELPRALDRMATNNSYGTYRRPLSASEQPRNWLERSVNKIPGLAEIRVRNPFYLNTGQQVASSQEPADEGEISDDYPATAPPLQLPQPLHIASHGHSVSRPNPPPPSPPSPPWPPHPAQQPSSPNPPLSTATPASATALPSPTLSRLEPGHSVPETRPPGRSSKILFDDPFFEALRAKAAWS